MLNHIRSKSLLLLLSAAALLSCVSPKNNDHVLVSIHQKSDPWWAVAKKEIGIRLVNKERIPHAKNVILFVGDGMGISTVTAARIFDGQSRGGAGEENYLSFEHFPSLALVKTYNSDSQVPDSAGTASALNTGIKSPIGTINIFHNQRKSACPTDARVFPTTFAEIAESMGMATGVVTNTRVTHATPAAVYAHSPNRGWEYDAKIPPKASDSGCVDIASQLVNFSYGDGIDVVMGGGRDYFLTNDQGGLRQDKRDLISEWRTKYDNVDYVTSSTELQALERNTTGKLIGLFSKSMMAYESERHSSDQPSLTEMTLAAVDRLSQNKKGYFLMVEAGRIDHAHHATYAADALNETQQLSKAVEQVLDRVDLRDTLILVTADHSHTFVIGGYPKKGNPILGSVVSVDKKTGLVNESPDLAMDGKPYSTLGYFTGPLVRSSPEDHGHDIDHGNDVEGAKIKQRWEAAIPLEAETHGGEDVAVYAIGAGSSLVSGVMEQHSIFHVMAHALGWSW